MADNINWPPTLGGAWYLWDNRLGGVPRPARPLEFQMRKKVVRIDVNPWRFMNHIFVSFSEKIEIY